MDTDAEADVVVAVDICTLMAAESDWGWVADHTEDLAAAARQFVHEVIDSGDRFADGLWLSRHFGEPGHGFTLATRGQPRYGFVAVAALETDRMAHYLQKRRCGDVPRAASL
ncbi:hypothetical protein [Gordonia alkanivorans]|uniref:hypothetical protein n=1 Tax=Gordonia alkanivorans TaxID=84096 RepID=UPI0004BA08C1|nr:hypothetical protein [Gordonia alkanivorans]